MPYLLDDDPLLGKAALRYSPILSDAGDATPVASLKPSRVASSSPTEQRCAPKLNMSTEEVCRQFDDLRTSSPDVSDHDGHQPRTKGKRSVYLLFLCMSGLS